MNLADAQHAWHADPPGNDRDDAAYMSRVRAAERFQSTIFRRDVVETAAAVFVAAAFVPALFGFPTRLAWCGVWVILAGLLAIVVVLHWTRRHGGETPLDAPLAEYFQRERQRVDRQIWLLQYMAIWYLAPCYVGVCMVVLGLPLPWVLDVSMCGAITALYAAVYWLNQRAVRRELLPLRQSLAAAEQEFAEGAGG